MAKTLDRRRFLSSTAALLAGTAAMPVLSACGGGGGGGGSKATEITALLVTGGTRYPKYWKQITADFKKKTGITVKYDLLEFTPMTSKEVTLGAARSKQYDVYSTHTAQIEAFFSIFEPLNDHLSSADKKDYYPVSLKYLTNPANGELAALPRNIDSRTQYYQPDLYTQAGVKPAETWDDLIDVGKKLTTGGHYGLVVPGQGDPGQRQFTDFLWQAGGDWLDDSNHPAFNSPEGVEALTFYHDLIKKYKITPGDAVTYQWDENSANFSNKTCATVFDWPGAFATYSSAADSKIAGNFGTAALPKHKTAISNAISHAMAVNRFSDRKDAALEFVKYTVGHDAQVLDYTAFKNFPSRQSVADEVTKSATNPKEKEWLDQLHTTIDNGKEWPKVPGFSKVCNIIYDAIEKALSGQSTPKAALDDAATQSTKVLKQSGAIH